ncbi:hypothetical protein LCM20_17520 [Halobacillus litoralis]|uniref:hypothetical protein n=1 Tax=Halobacillus litoralis TaxID=45668 RepID=UPI001CD7358F|nr:hypothetical protein [Halobacillus litoralis]MCA0972397.1 hypothetical protein [Halobacillus litoralis]
MPLRLDEVFNQLPWFGVLSPTDIAYYPSENLVAVGSTYEPESYRSIHFESLKRVVIFHSVTKEAVAVYEHSLPIHKIVFHPELPILMIAYGSYDGGFKFEGNVIVWNYKTNTSYQLLEKSREVVDVWFDEKVRLFITVSPEDDVELDEMNTRTIYWVDPCEESSVLCQFKEVGAIPFQNLHQSLSQQRRRIHVAEAELRSIFPSYRPSIHITDSEFIKGKLFTTSIDQTVAAWSKAGAQKALEGDRGLQILQDDHYVYLLSESMRWSAESERHLPFQTLKVLYKSTFETVEVFTLENASFLILNSKGGVYALPLTPMIPFTDRASQVRLYQGSDELELEEEPTIERVPINDAVCSEVQFQLNDFAACREPIVTGFDAEGSFLWEKSFDSKIIDFSAFDRDSILGVILENGHVCFISSETGEDITELEPCIMGIFSPALSIAGSENVVTIHTLDDLVLQYEIYQSL